MGSFITIFKRTLRYNNLLQEWYSDINKSSKVYHYKNKCILEAETYLSLDMSTKYILHFLKI